MSDYQRVSVCIWSKADPTLRNPRLQEFQLPLSRSLSAGCFGQDTVLVEVEIISCNWLLAAKCAGVKMSSWNSRNVLTRIQMWVGFVFTTSVHFSIRSADPCFGPDVYRPDSTDILFDLLQDLHVSLCENTCWWCRRLFRERTSQDFGLPFISKHMCNLFVTYTCTVHTTVYIYIYICVYIYVYKCRPIRLRTESCKTCKTKNCAKGWNLS